MNSMPGANLRKSGFSFAKFTCILSARFDVEHDLWFYFFFERQICQLPAVSRL
jgi:hypothetical protein